MRQHDPQKRFELRVSRATETTALECKLRCAKNAATARTNARFVRAMHVVFEVTNYKRAICVQNTCALYVTAKNCQKVTTTIIPRAECQTCKLFGHVAKDCVTLWTSTSIGLTFCSQNPKAPCRRTLQKFRSKQSLFAPMALCVQSLAGICYKISSR